MALIDSKYAVSLETLSRCYDGYVGESKIEIVIRLEQRPAPFDIHRRERFKGQDANRNTL